jgi:hypothetical protein
LFGSQAAGRIAGSIAEQIRGIVVAERGVLKDAVFVAVELVALLQHVGVNGGPLRRGYEGVRCSVPGGAVERAAPGGEVVEGDGWSACNNTIKFLRELLRCLEALAAASRAAKVVGLVVLFSIEGFADLLSDLGASV